MTLNLEEIEARCRLAELSEGEMYYAEAAASIVETDVPALCREVRRLRSIVDCRTYCCDEHMREIEELRTAKESLEKLLTEFKEFQITGVPGEITARLKSDMFFAFTASIGEMLKDYGAENFLTLDVMHPTVGKLTVTIQKANHETPTEQLGRLRDWQARAAVMFRERIAECCADLDCPWTRREQALLSELKEPDE